MSGEPKRPQQAAAPKRLVGTVNPQPGAAKPPTDVANPAAGAKAERAGAAAPNRYRGWYWYVLGTGLLALVMWAVSRKPAGPSAQEKTILDKLSDYGVRYDLDGQGRVVRLLLEGNRVTDEALDEVGGLPHLHRLSLQNSLVSDHGLLKISAACPNLQSLGITNTRVTDQGLAYLGRMPSLRNIWVTVNEKLTPQGIAALRRALPGVQVHVMNQRGKDATGQKGVAPADKSKGLPPEGKKNQ